MDERVRRHASILVDWSARVEAGDHVVVEVGPAAHDLAVATAEELGKRGASVHVRYASNEIERAFVTAHEGSFATPVPERTLFEASDVVLRLGGARNRSETAAIPAESDRDHRRVRQSVREAKYRTRWVGTEHPTSALAQAANMSTEAYRDFAYNAILRDWEALAAEMSKLQSVFHEGDTLRLVSRDTDLSMSISGRKAVNSAASVAYDSHNLPSGEVFTAPAQTDGTIRFDIPMTIRGRSVRDVEMRFRDGAVTEVRAANGGDLLHELIETDAGARRVGEFGVGMNRGIDRYTNNILFDEKMNGTVHLALGRAYDACLPPAEVGNDSAIHVDLLCDVTEESRLEVDGDVIQRDGVFFWEDDFRG